MFSYSSHKSKLAGGFFTLVLIIIGVTFAIGRRHGKNTPAPPVTIARVDTPAELAQWAWPKSQQGTPHLGVTHWFARSRDGTTVDLLEFDFKRNPYLRFELYDQDEDDKQPFDNVADYRTRGLGHVVRHLNGRLRAKDAGRIVAAWNGLFFGYSRKTQPVTAFHVAPVVLRGRVYYTRTNHRWAFGVKYVKGRPHFKVLYLPTAQTLAQEFDFGGGSAQCLVKDGKPLKLQPFPRPDEALIKPPVPTLPQEAGHIPKFDHMKSTRASLGWSRDGQRLYLLFVKETDTEAASIYTLRWRLPDPSGWTVADLQRFWIAMVKSGKVWNAINSDAGGAGQLTYLRPDGKYVLLPPGGGTQRLLFGADFKNAQPGGDGGAIMYFYVRDNKQSE